MGMRSRCCLALLAAALGLSQAPLHAETNDQSKPAKPLKLMESPRGVLEAAHFGDMLGLPDWMAMSLSLVSQPMGNLTGSKQRTFSSIDMQAIDLGLSRGFGKDIADIVEFDRWSGRASIASYLGPPPYFSTEIDAAFPLQSLVDSPGINEGIWLQGLWLQRDSKELTLKVGNNLSLDPLLETAAYNFYVNSTINSTLNLSLPGYPIAPSTSMGGIASWRATDRLTLNYGAFQLSNQRAGNQVGQWRMALQRRPERWVVAGFQLEVGPQRRHGRASADLHEPKESRCGGAPPQGLPAADAAAEQAARSGAAARCGFRELALPKTQ